MKKFNIARWHVSHMILYDLMSLNIEQQNPDDCINGISLTEIMLWNEYLSIYIGPCHIKPKSSLGYIKKQSILQVSGQCSV